MGSIRPTYLFNSIGFLDKGSFISRWNNVLAFAQHATFTWYSSRWYKSALTPKNNKNSVIYLSTFKIVWCQPITLIAALSLLEQTWVPNQTLSDKVVRRLAPPRTQTQYFCCTVYHHVQGWVLNHGKMKHLPAHRAMFSLHLMSTLNSLYEVKTCMYSCVPNQLSQTGGQSWSWLIASPEQSRIRPPLTSLQA
jgi:hypothetical protein